MPERHVSESPATMTQPKAKPDRPAEHAATIARELDAAKRLGLIANPSQTDSIRTNLELLDDHYRVLLSTPSEPTGRPT